MAARASSYSADAAFCTAGNTDPGIRARARNVGQITELTLDANDSVAAFIGLARLTFGVYGAGWRVLHGYGLGRPVPSRSSRCR